MRSAPADGSEPSCPRAAEDALVRAFEPLVRSRASSFARPDHPVDDLAQEARLGVLRAVRALGSDAVQHAVAHDDAPARRTRAYVARSVGNALVDAVRHEVEVPDVVSPDEIGEDRHVHLALGIDLRTALGALTAKQAATAHALAHGLSLRHAAEFLGVSVAAVRERRDAAFAKLRPRLLDYAPLAA